VNDNSDSAGLTYLNLKRVSTLGFIAILVWFSIVAGIMFLLSGDSIGWISLAIGIVIIASPISNPFRRYWRTGNSAKTFPIITFAANVILIIIYGNVLLTLLSDPYIYYNDQNTFSVYLWGGATILSIIALLANIGALVVDRRDLTHESV